MLDRPLTSVLWDLGGVLIDVDLSPSRTLWSRETGLSASSFDHAFFGTRLWEEMVVGDHDEEEIANKINTFVKSQGGAVMALPQFIDMWNACLHPRSQVVELVRRVAKKVDVGVLSDTDPIHAKLIQDEAGVFDVVKAWTFSFDVGVRKPDPVIYRAALANMGSAAENTLFIDDRPDNVAGARAAGLDSFVYQGVDDLKEQLARRALV